MGVSKFVERYGAIEQGTDIVPKYYRFPVPLDRIHNEPFALKGDFFTVIGLSAISTTTPPVDPTVYVKFNQSTADLIRLGQGFHIATPFEKFWLVHEIQDEGAYIDIALGEAWQGEPPLSETLLRSGCAQSAVNVPVAPANPIHLTTGSIAPVRSVAIANMDAANRIFVGDVAVTIADGFPVGVGESMQIDKTHQWPLYGIAENGIVEVRILEVA